jgi:hypothetical protein
MYTSKNIQRINLKGYISESPLGELQLYNLWKNWFGLLKLQTSMNLL